MKNHVGLILLSYVDFPFYRGSSRRLDGLLHVLIPHGIHVRVICPLFQRNLPYLPYKKFVDYIDLRSLKAVGSSKTGKIVVNFIFSILAIKKIVHYSMRMNLVVQYQDMYSSLQAIFAKLVLGSKTIGDDVVPIYLEEGRIYPSLSAIFHFLDLLILRFTDVIITASPKAYSFIRTSLKNKPVLFVPNGVLTLPKKQVFKKKIGKERKKLMIFVGSLDFDQNLLAVKNIFQVARNLLEKREDFEILVVGGPLRSVSYLLNDNLVEKGIIRFLGYVSDIALENIYTKTFIGLLPFFQETPLYGGQRIKALEYFSHGLLVVSGPEGINGINNLKTGKHCLLALSINEMFKILDDCLSNLSKYDYIRINGMKFINSNYSWDVLAKDYIKMIKDIGNHNQQLY